MMTTLAWIGAGMGGCLTGRVQANAPRKTARKAIAAAPKVSNPSLGYLASHARIAIHHGEFSPSHGKMARCTRNKIAQADRAGLRVLPAGRGMPERRGNPNSRVEESRRDRSQNPERDP